MPKKNFGDKNVGDTRTSSRTSGTGTVRDQYGDRHSPWTNTGTGTVRAWEPGEESLGTESLGTGDAGRVQQHRDRHGSNTGTQYGRGGTGTGTIGSGPIRGGPIRGQAMPDGWEQSSGALQSARVLDLESGRRAGFVPNPAGSPCFGRKPQRKVSTKSDSG